MRKKCCLGVIDLAVGYNWGPFHCWHFSKSAKNKLDRFSSCVLHSKKNHKEDKGHSCWMGFGEKCVLICQDKLYQATKQCSFTTGKLHEFYIRICMDWCTFAIYFEWKILALEKVAFHGFKGQVAKASVNN